jgi:F-type H+-transporting ATPase subunit epsilon
MALQVELVSPERILYSGEATMVVARSDGGEIAFLTGHAPFVGTLGIARVRIHTTGGEVVVAAVHAGFVEVKDNRVTILSDVAELADQIDVERARAALAAAGDDDLARRRAETRLEAAGVTGTAAGTPGH